MHRPDNREVLAFFEKLAKTEGRHYALFHSYSHSARFLFFRALRHPTTEMLRISSGKLSGVIMQK